MFEKKIEEKIGREGRKEGEVITCLQFQLCYDRKVTSMIKRKDIVE